MGITAKIEDWINLSLAIADLMHVQDNHREDSQQKERLIAAMEAVGLSGGYFPMDQN
jgi:hypothetical protein